MKKKIIGILLALCVLSVPAALASENAAAQSAAALDSAAAVDSGPVDSGPYEIRIAAVANGTLRTSENSASSGATVTVTAVPAAGYTLQGVTVRDSEWNAFPVTALEGGGGAAFTFTMPPCPVVVSAIFSAPTYVISVARTEHGKVSVLPMIAANGSTVTISAFAERGCRIAGFYAFDANGNRLSVTDRGDGTATFVMPAGRVEVGADFTVSGLQNFVDVRGTDWYFEEVKWACEEGIMMGVSETNWSPNDEISTATAVTVLARMAGVNLEPYMNDYYDYPWIPADWSSDWYIAAARWAAYEGFLTENIFTGREPLSRAGLAVMLRGFLLCQGVNLETPQPRFQFTDAAEVSAMGPEVSEAFQILRQAKIFGGYTDGTIRPYIHTTRAQLATLLHRLSLLLPD